MNFRWSDQEEGVAYRGGGRVTYRSSSPVNVHDVDQRKTAKMTC